MAQLNDAWRMYTRRGWVEARPYVPGEDLSASRVSVSAADRELPTLDGGMVARNPDNHDDQWYVNPTFFAERYSLPAGVVEVNEVPPLVKIGPSNNVSELMYAAMMDLFAKGDSAIVGTLTLGGNVFTYRFEVTNVVMPAQSDPDTAH